MSFSVLKLLDQDCRSIRVTQLMFGKEFLIEGNFVIGIALCCFLCLNDDSLEIIVAK
jgi:hypothetical protein